MNRITIKVKNSKNFKQKMLTHSQGSSYTSPGAALVKEYDYDPSLRAPSYMRKLFFLSLIPFFTVFYFMYDMSQQYYDNSLHNGHPIRLREGWFFGRMIDLSDHQWSAFRKFIPLLFVVGAIHVAISQTLRKRVGKVKIEINFF
jgi:hypothetical protein